MIIFFHRIFVIIPQKYGEKMNKKTQINNLLSIIYISIYPYLTGKFITLQSVIKYPTFAGCLKVAHYGAIVQKVVNPRRIWYNKASL